MGFIIEGFFGLLLLVGAVWLVLFLRTKRHEDSRLDAEKREETRERLLLTPGEILYCAACQKTFEGPLPEEGCPHCNCGAFVVPDSLRAQSGSGISASRTVSLQTQGNRR